MDKEKYEYILNIWEKESTRDEKIENKAKFLFSVATLILGSLIFKIDLLIKIMEKAENEQRIFLFCIFGLIIAINLAFMFSVYWILKALKIKGFRPIFPSSPLKALYDKDSKFFIDDSINSFYNAMGKYILSSFEYNRNLIETKSRYVNNAWICLIAGITLVIIFIVSHITMIVL
jgi:hypothetical protein